jgi:hypothetical protein
MVGFMVSFSFQRGGCREPLTMAPYRDSRLAAKRIAALRTAH